jgi:hypothetical protein
MKMLLWFEEELEKILQMKMFLRSKMGTSIKMATLMPIPLMNLRKMTQIILMEILFLEW